MPTRRGRQRWTSALPANQPSTAALRSLTASADAARDVHLAARHSLGRDVLLVGPSSPDDGFGGWRAGLGSWLADNGFEVRSSGAAPWSISVGPPNQPPEATLWRTLYTAVDETGLQHADTLAQYDEVWVSTPVQAERVRGMGYVGPVTVVRPPLRWPARAEPGSDYYVWVGTSQAREQRGVVEQWAEQQLGRSPFLTRRRRCSRLRPCHEAAPTGLQRPAVWRRGIHGAGVGLGGARVAGARAWPGAAGAGVTGAGKGLRPLLSEGSAVSRWRVRVVCCAGIGVALASGQMLCAATPRFGGQPERPPNGSPPLLKVAVVRDGALYDAEIEPTGEIAMLGAARLQAYETDAAMIPCVHSGNGSRWIINYTRATPRPVYEYRSGLLISGAISPDGSFVPERGSKIVGIDEWGVTVPKLCIYNLPANVLPPGLTEHGLNDMMGLVLVPRPAQQSVPGQTAPAAKPQ